MYPPPGNFTSEFVTGGPLLGGTDVVIEGGGFTKGYRRSDIDISSVRHAARRRPRRRATAARPPPPRRHRRSPPPRPR